MLLASQAVTFWLAISLYATANVVLAIRLAFNKPFLEKVAVWLVGLAIADHLALITFRWIQVQHGPYIDLVEIMTSDALALATFYFLIALFKKEWRAIGIVALPLVWLMMGVGALDFGSNTRVPLGTQNLWLVLHVVFAKFAYGSYLLAAVLAAYWLYLKRRQDKTAGNRLSPESAGGAVGLSGPLDRLDLLTYRLIAFGFLMQAVQVASGSVWAKRLWGRFWGWDPIETWSLIAWIGYGILLHLRRTYGWRGTRAAWLTALLALLMIFAFFLVPYVYNTVHTAYLARG